MQVSYNLLKEYINIDGILPEKLTNKLTMNGIILERMENISAAEIEKVVVGRVIALNKHPESENLSVCKVDIKGKTLQIVCGAQNIKIFNKVAVALEGAKLPKLGIIKSKKFKNILSSGMLCSAFELGVEPGKSSGILILEEYATLV
jgi:phenylalanyl-tRNA synthetase beta chain